MTEPQGEFPPGVPYGAHPRRSLWPLVVLIAAFALWFGMLIWMAVRYPAH